MEMIYETGITLIYALQNNFAWLMPIMRLFTFLGNEEFYLLIAPALFWCIQPDLGLRVGIYLMVSASINSIVKIFLHTPRPYWYDARIRALTTESSFGLPSGHAQNSVVVWGTIAQYIGRWWGWLLSIAIILMIGISRMFLGVHFPIDVLIGWAIGTVLLILMLRLEKPLLRWIEPFSLRIKILLIFTASIGIIIIGFIVQQSQSSWQLPVEWLPLAINTSPASEPINPFSLESLVSNAGALFGLAAGAYYLKSKGGFKVQAPLGKLALRYGLGVVGILIIWMGLKAIFPGGETSAGLIFRYIRYALVGLWMTVFAPLIFVKLHLAERADG